MATVPKPSGGTRSLAIGAVEDRVVERAVLDVLDPWLTRSCPRGASPTGVVWESKRRSAR